MTATVTTAQPCRAASVAAAPGRPRRRRSTLALVTICAVAGVLYAWRIGSSGWGNPYYSAAVKSMSASLTNFVFGSFDPLGVVTVDKPPMALWPMVGSAAVFGYHGWSLLLPQALEGVAAVFLLHRTVRRWAGEPVALLAALVFALTPVTVAINRDTNPDTLMVLLLVAAAYALTRATQCPRTPGPRTPATATRWLLLAAVFLGLGFVTKMLQAWIVVPAFALAYLVGSAASVRRRILDLLGAGAVLLASALWWVGLVSAWPGPKPYIGGSTNGSVLNLVIGYNGLGRILGRQFLSGPVLRGPVFDGPGGDPGNAGRAGHGGFGGAAGITRLFGVALGGQISWLLPLGLLVLGIVAIGGIRQLRSTPALQLPEDRARRAGWFLWGGWLLLVGLVLSVAQRGFHPYYTSEMAPALAAVTAAGVSAMWRHYRQPDGYHWALLPAAVTLTVGWAWVLLSRDPSWYGWLRYGVVAVGALAVTLLVAGRLFTTGRLVGTGMARVAEMLGVVALLLAPGVWSSAAAFSASGDGLAQAGPPASAFGRGAITAARGERPARSRGAMAGELTAEQRALLAYAQANSGTARIALAVEGGARDAEAYLIHSDATVIGMGGFSGQDPAPTVATLAHWVQQGQLRYVLLSHPDHDGPDGPGTARADPAGTATQGPAGTATQSPAGTAIQGRVTAQRIQWVQQHCVPVTLDVPVTPDVPVSPGSSGGSTLARGHAAGSLKAAAVLYDCLAS